MTARTRIFIVDDHPLVREWLGNLLRLETDLEVAGWADAPAAALEAMARHPPDIAIVDLSFPRGSGLDLIKDLRVRAPATRVIVLSMHEEIADVERALRAGARGYVMKRESTDQIVDAIRQVQAGRVYASPEVHAKLTERMVGRTAEQRPAGPESLSDRELEVFRRLGEGHSTARIANDLGVGHKTVQTYCARIKEKLALGDGSQLVRAAIRWRDTGRM